MSRFDDMIQGLREEVEIPDSVWRGYTRTLAELPERGGYKNRSGRGKNKYSSRKFSLSAAA